MMRLFSSLVASSVLTLFARGAVAQTPPPSPIPAKDHVPIYRITVVQRALEAVNFERHAGPTEIDLKPTVLMPKSEGRAIVEVKNGYTKIDLNLKKVRPPTIFGTEFLTYVLWAITPNGKAVNLGEVIVNGSDKASMHVTSPYSTFGLLITAEPYFSVPYPSDVVIMESAVRPDTVGRVEEVQAKYELLPRGQYTLNIQASQLASAHMKSQRSVSMEEYEAVTTLYQARNAVQIARADGAGRAAPDTLAKAQNYLNQAEAAYAQKNYRSLTDSARQAVEAASDARTIAMRQKGAPGSQQ
ncbi:MAG TPA: hypothetical protein VGL97_07150 [Bryobacteraceae bacterium]|jgi:hypothetical protein